jgi:iron complex outermembrane receptor protein
MTSRSSAVALVATSLASAGLLSAQPSTAPAAAASADSAIPLAPITVTAQKRGQSISEVPLSLNAYTGTFLETFGVTRYEDLAPLVPGFFVSVQSPTDPSLNMRGVSTDSTDPRAETRISVFQDGVSISRTSASVSELFDLERVEVLKGPQGTLFGRSAGAGAISLISRKPSSATEGSLTLGAGNYDSYHLSGHYNTPLGSEHLLARVAFTSDRREGTVHNLADDSTLNGRETVAVRPSLRWAPSPDTTLDLVVNFQRDTPPGVAFKSGVIPTSRGDTDPFTAAELNRGATLGADRTTWGATGLLSHRLAPAVTLHAITGWREFDSLEEFDGDGSRLMLLELSEKATGRQFSQEVRVNYDASGPFTAFAGVNFSRERARQRVGLATDERQVWPFLSGTFRDGLIAAGVPSALANVVVPPANPFVAQPRLPAGFAALAAVPPLSGLAALAGAPLKAYHLEHYITTAELDSTDLFADGTWRVTPSLELTAGARLSVEKQTAGYQVINSPVPSTLGFILGATPNFAFAPTGGNRTDSDRATGWSGRLAARYILTPDLNVYASLSRGRRPETLTVTSVDKMRASEESIVNAEVGVKGSALQRRLIYSAAVFQYRYRHFQTFVQDPANLARVLSIDAGRATGRGGEASLQGVVNPHASIFATYGYTDATFDRTGDHGEVQRFAGSTFRLTARHTAALGATFEQNAGALGRFSLSPVWQYKSGHFFEDDNTRDAGRLHQSGFAVVNLRLAWRSPDRRWEAAAYADNLFDKAYLVDAGNIGDSFGLPTFVRGQPRLFGARATLRF